MVTGKHLNKKYWKIKSEENMNWSLNNFQKTKHQIFQFQFKEINMIQQLLNK